MTSGAQLHLVCLFLINLYVWLFQRTFVHLIDIDRTFFLFFENLCFGNGKKNWPYGIIGCRGEKWRCSLLVRLLIEHGEFVVRVGLGVMAFLQAIQFFFIITILDSWVTGNRINTERKIRKLFETSRRR
jgi:hypothetical protein